MESYKLIEVVPKDFYATIKGKKHKFIAKKITWANHIKWEKKYGGLPIEKILIIRPFEFMTSVLWDSIDLYGKFRFRTLNNFAAYITDLQSDTDDLATQLLLLIGRKFEKTIVADPVLQDEPKETTIPFKNFKLTNEQIAENQNKILLDMLSKVDNDISRKTLLNDFFNSNNKH